MFNGVKDDGGVEDGGLGEKLRREMDEEKGEEEERRV